MSSRELSPAEFIALVVAVAAVAAFCFLSWQLASWTGVNFSTVASSLWLTILWVVITVLLYLWVPMFPRSAYLAAAICLTWPAWFEVVREAAQKHAFIPQLTGFELEQNDLFWWGRDTTLYSSEITLIALSAWVLWYLSNRNRYGC